LPGKVVSGPEDAAEEVESAAIIVLAGVAEKQDALGNRDGTGRARGERFFAPPPPHNHMAYDSTPPLVRVGVRVRVRVRVSAQQHDYGCCD